MVATRKSTNSLPERKQTFAELQASQSSESSSKPVSRAKASSKKRTREDDSPSKEPLLSHDEASHPAKRAKRAVDTEDIATSDQYLTPPSTADAAQYLRDTSNVRIAAAKAVPRKAKPSKARIKQSIEQSATLVSLKQADLPAGGQTSFFSLPPELRNEVYDYAISQRLPIRIDIQKPYLLEPALLAVSHQMRSEASTIWYGENWFEIDGSSPAIKFLRSLSDHKLRALRTLRIYAMQLPSEKYVEDRIEQLLREFGPRGLGRDVIYFPMNTSNGSPWFNLSRLKSKS